MFQGLLSLIAYVPLAGALILLFFPKDAKKGIAYFATAVAALDFLISLPLFFQWDTSLAGFDPRTLEKASWIPSIGAQYIFGVDGISMLFVLLTTLLGVV